MEKNRRRAARLQLALPVRVTGHGEHEGQWQEISETLDVSRAGVRLSLARKVRRGQVLHLMLPLPWRLRQHGHADPSYRVYAVVQRVLPSSQPGLKQIGLEFIGEHPPASYLERPWATYQPAEWRGENRRRTPREFRSEVVWVVYLDEEGHAVAQEGGRTVDVSRSGARVCVQQPPKDFSLVRVTAPECGFESLALVVNHSRRESGLHHLSLHWMGAEWPMEK